MSPEAQGRRIVQPQFQQAAQQATTEQLAVQNLYNTLVSGLRAGAVASQQRQLEGAQRRGVEQVSTQRNIEAALQPQAAQAQAQLGLGQAQTLANLGTTRSQARLAETQAAQQAAGTILAGQQQAQRAALQKQRDVAEFKMSKQQMERQFELDRQQAAIRAAQEAAARAAALQEQQSTVGQIYLDKNGRARLGSYIVRANEAGGYNLYDTSGKKADADLWQAVISSGGDRNDLISLLARGDLQDQTVARNYGNQVKKLLSQGRSVQEAQEIGWEYIKQARPTAFYKSERK